MDVVNAIRELREQGIELEDWLGVNSTTIARWEAQQAAPSKHQQRQLAWLLGAAENDRLREHARLPVCPTRARLESTMADVSSNDAPDTATLQKAADALIDHVPTCATCSANQEWERRNLRQLGSFPLPGMQGILVALASRIPSSLLPAILGAIFLGGVVAIRVIFAILGLMIRDPNLGAAAGLARAAVPAILAAAGAGASGGLVIPLVRPALRKMGAVGDYLTGVVVVEAYIIALCVLAPVAFKEPLVNGSSEWMFMLAGGAVFGIIGAYSYRRTDTRSVTAGAA